jgi:hypothetical protein
MAIQTRSVRKGLLCAQHKHAFSPALYRLNGHSVAFSPFFYEKVTDSPTVAHSNKKRPALLQAERNFSRFR